MKYTFISDCHLSPKRPQIIAHFIDYLSNLHHSTDELYILGDLFDIWTDDNDQYDGYRDCLSTLNALSQHIPIFFICGNRDFLVGKQFVKQSGCQILPEICIKNLNGKPTLIMHGDLLCTLDVTYQRYRKIIRHPLLRHSVKFIPSMIRRMIGQKLAQASHRVVKQKTAYEMDVNPDTVLEYMLKYETTRLIHGHTHRPAIHHFIHNEIPMERIVLGDWYNDGSVLEIDGDVVNLKTLALST